MNPLPYPQSYLDGNIELQAVVDNSRSWTHRTCLKWLMFTCAFFTLLLLGVILESRLAVVVGLLELVLCAHTVHFLLTPNGDHL